MQFVKHFTRQAVDVINSEKEKKRAPTKIAPITLVAAKVIIERIAANKMVPRLPNKTAANGAQQFLQEFSFWDNAAARSVIARYAIAIPKATVTNIGARVITPVICKNAAMIPIIKLAIKERAVQLYFVSQVINAILNHLLP